MSPLQPPEEEKRVGRVFYTPGTKTPRRVQWLDKDPVSSSHSLDEQGLDPAAFQRLTQALERHKASLTARVHHYPPQPEPAHTIDISELGSTLRISSSHTPQSRPSLSSMESEESSPPSSFDPTSPHHYVPGNYIDATERAGLPETSDPLNVAQEQAEKVVGSHMTKRQLGEKLKFGRRWNKTKRLFDGDRGLDDNCHNMDIERDAGVETSHMRGRGVLSTLLSLYGQESDLVSSMSTPGSYSLSLDDSPDPDRPLLRSREDHQNPFYRPGSRSLTDRRHLHLVKEVTPESPSLSRQSTLLGTEPKKEPSLQQFSPSAFFHRHKNSKTRSGAGVFGPLIASTGNLTGVVAPTQSQLQPDFKRPGYRLSRYSFDEKPQSSGMSSRVPSRARSTYDDSTSYAPSILSAASSPPSPTATDPGPFRSKWTGMLKDMSIPSIRSFGGRSGASTPARSTSPMFGDEYLDLKRPFDGENWKDKKRKRKRARVFITRHVAHILERQAFILKFARAMMMFGAPSHRLQSQITSTAHVLDLEMSCVYFPDVLLVSFDDSSTSTSNIKIIRQGSSLDLVKLVDAYQLYWKVIHDKLSVSNASAELDNIMCRPQLYNWWKLFIFGGMCSSSICTVSFDGSFIDALVVFPMGALLIIIQLLSVRNELYSNVFEVTVTTLFSFIAAALAASRRFCYSAVASSSVVLILPGFIVLNGALELMSRNIVAGSVRLGYAIVYALFLGFGLAMGAKAFVQITGKEIVGSTDVVCSISHYEGAPWYQQTPSKLWAFLTVPMFSLFLSLRNQAPYDRIELPLLVGIACVGWVTNHFTGTAFVDQTDISAAVGAFAVGIVANMYARLFKGNAFVVMITGILFQVPSGLGSGGLLNYVSLQTHGDSNSYLSGFQTALKLVSVGIGLTVGLGISLVLMHPVQSRRRAGGIFSL